MRLPCAQEYQEAVQNPLLAFSDPELKAATAYVNRFKLPISSAGGFAVVFRLKGKGRDWAVRCFTRAASDQERRYAAIASHLRGCKLPYMAAFEYVKKGIFVQGDWHPILKMEWVEGERLDSFVFNNLRDPKKLDVLSLSWKRMLKDLQDAEIAHGDLQHGNILVHQERLHLVDYDGMFVPSLKGMCANELGHRNYQHPERAQRHFDSNIDHFSSWVIYCSLLALSKDPSLWPRRQDDESLVLGVRDYKLPQQSAALKELRAHKDSLLSLAAEQVYAMLSMPVEKLPSLHSLSASPPPPPRTGGLPDWLSTIVRQSSGPQQATSVGGGAVSGTASVGGGAGNQRQGAGAQLGVDATGGAAPANPCPRCKATLVKKFQRLLQVWYFECSRAPACKYRCDDLAGLQLPSPATQVQSGRSQKGTSAGRGSKRKATPPLGNTAGSGKRGKGGSPLPKTRSTPGKKPRSAATRTGAIDECDRCGSRLDLLAGAQSFYICTNYPACDFMKPA